MSRAGRISAVAAFFALVALGLLSGSDSRVFTETTYGDVPSAHGVLFDTLSELGIPVSRSFAPVGRLPRGETVWWIEPPLDPIDTASADASAKEEQRRKARRSALPDVAARASELEGDHAAAWIGAGGTAVVLLDAADARAPLRIAGAAVPARVELREPGSEADDPPTEDERAAAGIEAAHEEPASERDPLTPSRSLTVVGEITRSPRTLALQWPVVFASAGEGWRVVARADGEPFVLARALGAGQLVVVADASFVWNRWLPRADAAPLALDLVRAYGVPRIDERAHGLSTSRGIVRTLARSWAAPFFVGLALFGVAFAWLGGALPRRAVGDAETPAPTLDTYVASLAGYYGASREYARVFERYRELTARRLRRALALPPDAPLASVCERARRSRRARPEAIALLAGRESVSDARGLAHAAAKLDELVRGVAG